MILVSFPVEKIIILCPILARNPDYIFAGKHDVHHLDAWRGQKSVQLFGFCDYFGRSTIVPLPQFPPHVFETKFRQTPFRSAIPD